MKKKFVELTREELIEAIIHFNDPELVGFDDIIITFNLEKEEDAFAVKLRDGKYFRADIDWNYWDTKEDPEWVEIPRDAFIELLHEDLAGLSLNELRVHYRRNQLEQKLVRDIIYLEAKNKLLQMDLAQHKELLGGEES